MRRARRYAGVKTDPAALKLLPQFRPELSFNIKYIDSETGQCSAFTRVQLAQLSEILASTIRPHLRGFDSKEQEQRLNRFLTIALSAVATYDHQRTEQENFDSIAAREKLVAAHTALLAANRALANVAMDRHLMRFLELLFVHQNQNTTSPETPTSKRWKRVEALARQLEQSEKSLSGYRAFNPRAAADQLSRLEPVLMLAAERLTFQPGDMQRDDIARMFTDMMASGWLEATGKCPSHAKPSPRSRNRSQFAALLTSINREFLKREFQSKNDFRDFAAASIRQLRRDFPDHCKGRSPLS
jgi:hypothetical protein